MPRSPASEAGQASVELVALLPLVAVLGAVLWQGVVAGQAAWASGTAARAAARAAAVGGDPRAAARATLPAGLRGVARVSTRDGGVVVRLGVPSVVGPGRLATITTAAAFPAQ